ncbi:MAG TPA: hypothetical protein VJ276_14140, partial [Thermoanaerobaculia bacterium]|nr:hypothetical protein [Thermoanaerobaculia bacterium]
MHGLLPLVLFLAAASPDAGGGEAPLLPVVRHVSQGGVGVTMTFDRVGGAKAAGPLREREDVAVRVELKDETTGAPVRGARPAVWLDAGRTKATSCRDRIDTYLGGKFLGRPDVDLNTFRVVSMNDDATLTVVDPLFGFGGTRLLAMVELGGPADDWALDDDRTSIFVTAPAAKQLARVETAGWTIAKSVTLPAPPHRLVLQPDEGYVWTATNEALVALRPADLSVAATIPLGNGRHDLIVSRDSKTVVATSYESGTVTVVDVAKLAVVKKVEIAAPVSVAWSGSSATAYVASDRGSIYAIDRAGIVATMKAAPGLKLVRTAPGERFVLAINPTEKSIDVIDVVANEIVQSGELPGIPDDIGFSDSVAYITLRDS